MLPMYKSRFRSHHTLISAVDICDEHFVSQFLDDPEGFNRMHPMVSPFGDLNLKQFLSRELFWAARDLHGLSYMLDICDNGTSCVGSVQQEYFEDIYAAVQHSLASFPHPNAAGVLESVQYYRQHSWRLAARMYFNIAIKNCVASAASLVAFV
jgi:hypothetical protein